MPKKRHEIPTTWIYLLVWWRKKTQQANGRWDSASAKARADTVSDILTEMRSIHTLRDLLNHYSAGDAWARDIAEGTQKRTGIALSSVSVSSVVATAYALRYVEISTGATIDPNNLPTWIGEWAVG